jgi:subtilisin family serine protease
MAFRKAVLVSAMAGSAVLWQQSSAQAVTVEYHGKPLDVARPGDIVPGEVVVVADTPAGRVRLLAMAERQRGLVARSYPHAGVQVWRAADAAALAAQLNQQPGIHAYANPKVSVIVPPEVLKDVQPLIEAGNAAAKDAAGGGTVTANWTSADRSVSAQWALWMVKEPLAPAPPTGVKGIAIIDTGVDYTNPELRGRVVSVKDYVDDDTDAMDLQGHGTHVAGIAAAAAGNGGIRGISPKSTIYAYRVLDEKGSGNLANVIAAIRDAADNPKVAVISLSLGAYVPAGGPAFNDVAAAVDYAVLQKGKVVVAAAGNEANSDMYYRQWQGSAWRMVPAAAPNSLTVGATTEADGRAWFSNYDITQSSYDGRTTYDWNFVDIVAPGTNILSTTLGDGYERWSGTSMAAPLVAGAAARLWDSNLSWTSAMVSDRLIRTGQPRCAANGFPQCERRLDLYRALGKRVAGGFMGRVLQGESGKPLAGVKVEALAGSLVKASTLTTTAGFYVLPSLGSYSAGYRLRFSKTGLVTRTTGSLGDRTARQVRMVADQPILPSRPSTATEENWRIVVTWPSTSPGRDVQSMGGHYTYEPNETWNAPGLEANAYLKTPTGDILGWANSGNLLAVPFARFPHDSWNDTPIETFILRDQQAGTYRFWVSADAADWCWGAIRYGKTDSPASTYPVSPMVLVYKGDSLRASISATTAERDGDGTKYWNVLTLKGDVVSVVNRVSDSKP